MNIGTVSITHSLTISLRYVTIFSLFKIKVIELTFFVNIYFGSSNIQLDPPGLRGRYGPMNLTLNRDFSKHTSLFL